MPGQRGERGPGLWLERTLASRPLAWLDQRLDLAGPLGLWLARPVPAVPAWPQLLWRHLGGLCVMLLALQVLGGLAMLPFYRAEPGQALASLTAIERSLPAGWLLRRLHAVGGHLLLALALGHALRALARGAHFPPRELPWLSGWLLLLASLGMVFSGGVLPGGQASLGQLAALWPGWKGPLGPGALSWALACHVGLPFLALVLAWLHLALVRRIGPAGHDPLGQVPLEARYPLGLIHAGLAGAGCLLLLTALALLWPQPFLAAARALPAPGLAWPLPGQADLLPWYLWAPAALAGLLPPGWGLALILVLSAAPALWPFCERGPARTLGQRPWLGKLLPLAGALWLGLSVWGAWKS